ncbi:MAG: carbohydrate kinase [Clostridiales bacterium]|nr:carbohydrate kinase [Clostridiales bacterium]
MILSIGEILADMIGTSSNQGMEFKAFVGGAPFNVAVNALQAGSKVGFCGRVGLDPIGRFLTTEAEKFGFNYLNIQNDDERNTTLAFVTLTDGERDFAFYRHDTADYNIELSKIDFDGLKELNIIHLGSLMLSEKNGVDFANKVVEKAKELGVKLSFDLNFRMDIYKDFDSAVKAYKPFVECADVVKFSDDELVSYTGINDFDEAVNKVYKPNTILVVTLGSKGSFYRYNDCTGVIPTQKVKPIDTTGAGDAFFGTFLSNIEGKAWNKEVIETALVKANKAGADTTQFLGAVKL